VLLDVLLETVPVGLGFVDPKLRFVRVNQALARTNGASVADHLGRRLAEVCPEAAPEETEALERVLATRLPVTDLEFVREQAGERRYLLASAYPVLDRDGEPLGAGLVLSCITDRKRAEEALRATKEELQTLIAASPLPIVAYDPDGVVTLWSKAAERVFGWSAEEAVGNAVPFVADEMRAEFDAIRTGVLDGASFAGYETVRRRKDGARIEIRFWNAPLRGPDGSVRGVVALLDDITERRRAERRLSAQFGVTMALAGAPELAEAGHGILEALGESFGFDAGAFWLPEEDTGLLRCAAFWSQPAAGLEAFGALTRQLAITPGLDLPGRAWERRAPVWVADLAADGTFLRAPVADLRSGLGVPVLSGGEPVGAVEFFGREPRTDDPEVASAVELICSQIAQYVENARAERERDRLLRALTQSEQRYRSLVEATAEIVWVTGADGEPAGVSSQWAEFTGQSHDEAAGRGWLECVHPDDRRRVGRIWDDAMASVRPYECEFRLRARDGSYREVVERGVPIFDDDGRHREWIGVCIDIGARKRKELALRFLAEASEVLASSLDYHATLARLTRLSVPTVADWCFLDMLREDGHSERLEVAHADPAKADLAAEVMRFSPRPDWDTPQARVLRTRVPLLVPEVTDEVIVAIAHDDDHLRVIREVAPCSLMYVALEARGRVLGAITFVSAESGRRYDEDDFLLAQEIARRAGVAVDNARLYHEAEERGEAARSLAAIGDGVFRVDAAGRIRLWNPGAEAITGLAAADVVGRLAGDAIPCWSVVEPRIPVAPSPGPAARAETVPIEIGGRELWLSISGVGSVEGTVYAFRDQTDERRVEEFEADLIATVCHELRTPLAAVYGAAMTLRRPDLELDDQTRRGLLSVIGDQAERLSGIVDDVLAASRLEAGSVRLERESFNPGEVATGVVDAARTHAPGGLRIDLRVAHGLPEAAGDADRVRQVLANLVENAVKYSPGGGVVVVDVAAENGLVRFTVSDHGIGIPEDELDRIFDRFYRLEHAAARGIGGTGLGLYICRELVRRMGGTIRAESELGSGSTFTVELPVTGSLL
jgi:PAS domain S-box-containing protein